MVHEKVGKSWCKTTSRTLKPNSFHFMSLQWRNLFCLHSPRRENKGLVLFWFGFISDASFFSQRKIKSLDWLPKIKTSLFSLCLFICCCPNVWSISKSPYLHFQTLSRISPLLIISIVTALAQATSTFLWVAVIHRSLTPNCHYSCTSTDNSQNSNRSVLAKKTNLIMSFPAPKSSDFPSPSQ